jgi:membrane protease subunit HflK
MYYETMERILSRVDTTIVEAPGVTPYLPLPEIGRRSAQPQPQPQPQGGQAR